jgi:hypothetical protein
MKKSTLRLWLFHLGGVIICSVVAFLIWAFALNMALSEVYSRPDDVARNSIPIFEKFCGDIADGMIWPLEWIPLPRGSGDFLMCLLIGAFWGMIIYAAVYGIFRLFRKGSFNSQ